MSDSVNDKPTGRWLSRLWPAREKSIVSLKLDAGGRPASPSPPLEPSLPVTPAKPPVVRLPKRHLRFQDPKGEHSFTAHPLHFVPGKVQHPAIQPGSHDALGNPGIWTSDFEVSETTDWVDDGHAGLFCRKLYRIEDGEGAHGLIDGVPYLFEDVLQVGDNLVVYQLTNLETCDYIAYAFDRLIFDARAALSQYLRRISENKEDCRPRHLIALADRVLEAFPVDDTALFNKGVALFAGGSFSEAQACFELSVKNNPGDILSLLYHAAALAAIEGDERAVDQFARADALSTAEVREHLSAFEGLRKLINLSVGELAQLAPPDHQVHALLLKYFSAG